MDGGEQSRGPEVNVASFDYMYRHSDIITTTRCEPEKLSVNRIVQVPRHMDWSRFKDIQPMHILEARLKGDDIETNPHNVDGVQTYAEHKASLSHAQREILTHDAAQFAKQKDFEDDYLLSSLTPSAPEMPIDFSLVWLARLDISDLEWLATSNTKKPCPLVAHLKLVHLFHYLNRRHLTGNAKPNEALSNAKPHTATEVLDCFVARPYFSVQKVGI
ncbi:MAG: hypothetical protein Q9210_005170 [Variospora velana]